MPEGTYLLGDPICSLRDHFRHEYVENRSSSRTPLTVQGRTCLQFDTGADGIYLDQDHFEYFVDSAAIGLLPIEITNVDDAHRPFVNTVTFDEPFSCLYEPQQGRMLFGHIRINLG